MAIFITGDTHGDFTRFKKGTFPEQAALTKDDYVIICGDFGGVWDGSPSDRYWLDWMDAKPFTTLFVTGSHENDEIYVIIWEPSVKFLKSEIDIGWTKCRRAGRDCVGNVVLALRFFDVLLANISTICYNWKNKTSYPE